MSKKILVIEDWIRFGQDIETCLIQFTTVQDSMKAINRLLIKHELKDVTELEAEVGIPFWDFHLSLPKCDHEHMAEIPKRFKLGEKVKVFVVKGDSGFKFKPLSGNAQACSRRCKKELRDKKKARVVK